MNKHFLLSNNVGYYLGRTQQYVKLLLTLLVYGLSFGSGELVQAQPNCSGSSVTAITKFADWDWTVTTNDPNYCATWVIQTGPALSTRFVVDAPWYKPKNGTLEKIYRDQDYIKAKGWELLRMDMGGRTPIATPYFILYNKYRGIIRTFFYINDVAPFTKGINITMSHSSANGSYSSGILALSQSLVQSQDYYLQNQNANHEIISYVPVFTSRAGWVFADFQTGFDSYAGSAQYSSSSLQFCVLAVTDSRITLDGKLNFKTDQQVQEGGYGIGGTATGVTSSGLNNFLANGQKILAAAGSDDLTKFKENFKNKADKTATTVPIPPVQAQQGALSKAVTDSGGSTGVFKKVAGIAGSLGSWVGLIGSIVGVLWPDDSPSAPAANPFYPTVSNGTLSLKGSITTTAPVTSFTMQIPGGQHFFPHPSGNTGTQTDGGNQTYYDCPLGIFTLKNTPVLGMKGFTTLYDIYSPNTDGWVPSTYTYMGYTSYLVTNDLIPVYNTAAGLKIESVQASIVAQARTIYFKQEMQLSDTGYGPNSVQQEVNSGEVEIVMANDSLVTYATPFIDIANFKNEAITTLPGDKVYVRVKAVLTPKDSPLGTPPIYFVQDYAIQPNTSVAATNPLYSVVQNTDDGNYYSFAPPYTNNIPATQFPGASPTPFTTVAGSPTATGSSAYADVTAGRYTAPIILSSGFTVAAGNPSRSPSGGNVTLDHPNTSTPSVFVSSQGVELGAGFSVTAGTNFIAATPLHAWKQGGPVLTESFGGPCSYNSNTSYNPVAYRTSSVGSTNGTASAAATADNLTVSPNPTYGIVTIATSVTGKTEAMVVVSDYMGQEIERIPSIPAGLSSQRINLVGKASGMYLIRLITKNKTVTQKVLLQ